jgi:hypothetical protein
MAGISSLLFTGIHFIEQSPDKFKISLSLYNIYIYATTGIFIKCFVLAFIGISPPVSRKGHFIGHSVGVEEIAHECIFPTIKKLHWVPFEISNVWFDYLR